MHPREELSERVALIFCYRIIHIYSLILLLLLLLCTFIVFFFPIKKERSQFIYTFRGYSMVMSLVICGSF